MPNVYGFDGASFDRWITTDPRAERECTCLGCREVVLEAETTDERLCTECAPRMDAARETEHVDCDCAECRWVARTMDAITAYTRFAMGPSAAVWAPEAPVVIIPTRPGASQCSTGECDCGCDYLGADAGF